MTDPNVLKTLDRALHILTLFDGSKPSWGVTELARHLDLPKSVVQKTLATFARRGFMYQEDVSRRYRLGPRMWTLARFAEPELARMAVPFMERLARATMETVKLTVVDGTETVIIAAVESPQSLRMTGRVGERNPLHRGATNKILAAHMPFHRLEESVRRFCRRHGNDESVDRTMAELEPVLDDIRCRGWAASVGELEEGVKAVAVPVVGFGGDVVASLSVVGPAARMKDSQNGRVLSLLRETSADVSRALGHGPDAEVTARRGSGHGTDASIGSPRALSHGPDPAAEARTDNGDSLRSAPPRRPAEGGGA